jgi:hypothetical protein
MPRTLPVKGHWPPPEQAGEFHENHAEHFGFAIQDAISNWYKGAEDDEQEGPEVRDVRVVLDATITSNPGGIKEYHATITTIPT